MKRSTQPATEFRYRRKSMMRTAFWGITIILCLIFTVSCQCQCDTTDYTALFIDEIAPGISLNADISLERFDKFYNYTDHAFFLVHNHSKEDVILPYDYDPRFYWKDTENKKWVDITNYNSGALSSRTIPAELEENPHGMGSNSVFDVSTWELRFVPEGTIRVYIEGTTNCSGRKVGAYIDIQLSDQKK
jgi:hypothetical protein